MNRVNVDEEEEAMNDQLAQDQQTPEQDDWRSRLPAFLRSNLEPEHVHHDPTPAAASSSTQKAVEMNADDSTTPAPLSKNAIKKAAKQARIEAEKSSRRAYEKEKAKARKAAQKAEFESGQMTPEQVEAYELKRKERNEKLRAKQKGGKVKDEEAWKGGIVIDLGFDELMTEAVSLFSSCSQQSVSNACSNAQARFPTQEIKSMASQLGYCHSANRLTTKPFLKIVYSGFSGQLKQRMETVMQGHYKVWSRSEWRDEDVGRLAGSGGAADDENTNATVVNPFPGQEYVYLTADSDYELETLREDQTYIVGGIVDKNRYKVSKREYKSQPIRQVELGQLHAHRISAKTRQTSLISKRHVFRSEPSSRKCLHVKY